jgi:hypothetical protein
MQEREFSLCRPAPGYWCVRCCEVDRCPVLGRLSDGTRGCTGHMTIANPEIHQLLSCKDHICYRKYFSNPDNIDKVREAILARPPGEFRISDFVSK